MARAIVEAIAVRASLEGGAEEIGRARQQASTGDELMVAWVEDYDRGAAMLIRLDVSTLLETDAGARRIDCVNRGVWVEKDIHPPLIAEQIRQIASKDFPRIARSLADMGLEVPITDLEHMYVDVELDAGVREALLHPAAGHEPGESPDADARHAT